MLYANSAEPAGKRESHIYAAKSATHFTATIAKFSERPCWLRIRAESSRTTRYKSLMWCATESPCLNPMNIRPFEFCQAQLGKQAHHFIWLRMSGWWSYVSTYPGTVMPLTPRKSKSRRARYATYQPDFQYVAKSSVCLNPPRRIVVLLTLWTATTIANHGTSTSLPATQVKCILPITKICLPKRTISTFSRPQH